jgi:hypothetical protein
MIEITVENEYCGRRVDAVEVTVDGADRANVILYCHGGVYVIGSTAKRSPRPSAQVRARSTIAP